MDRGRLKPVEGLRVLSVDAVLQICTSGWLQLLLLLSAHEVREREMRREGDEG